MLRHIVLCVLDIGQYQFILVLKIVEKFRVRHTCLSGDITKRYLVNGFCLYTALESHEDFHAYFFFINNNRHGSILTQVYHLVNKAVDKLCTM